MQEGSTAGKVKEQWGQGRLLCLGPNMAIVGRMIVGYIEINPETLPTICGL